MDDARFTRKSDICHVSQPTSMAKISHLHARRQTNLFLSGDICKQVTREAVNCRTGDPVSSGSSRCRTWRSTYRVQTHCIRLTRGQMGHSNITIHKISHRSGLALRNGETGSPVPPPSTLTALETISIWAISSSPMGLESTAQMNGSIPLPIAIHPSVSYDKARRDRGRQPS
jgi:hypothetical protein